MLSDPNSQGEIGLNVLADNEAFCTETRQWCAEVQSGETGGISLHPLGTHLDPSPVHNLSLVSFHFHLISNHTYIPSSYTLPKSVPNS